MRSFRSLLACAALAASVAFAAAPASFAADLTVTAASVLAGTDAAVTHGFAGETITQGQPVYLAAATRKWMKADSDAVTAEARGSTGVGVALNAASASQPLAVETRGAVTIGATLTPGVAYYLSNTAGGICPIADVGTGEYVVLLGLARSASVLDLAPHYTGVAN